MWRWSEHGRNLTWLSVGLPAILAEVSFVPWQPRSIPYVVIYTRLVRCCVTSASVFKWRICIFLLLFPPLSSSRPFLILILLLFLPFLLFVLMLLPLLLVFLVLRFCSFIRVCFFPYSPTSHFLWLARLILLVYPSFDFFLCTTRARPFALYRMRQKSRYPIRLFCICCLLLGNNVSYGRRHVQST